MKPNDPNKKCLKQKLDEACMVTEEMKQETVSLKIKNAKKELEDVRVNDQRTISKSGS